MKRILFILASIVAFSACSEDALVPTMVIDDTFDITDDPNDPVQHERYQLFKEYNVSVYFNDTIAKKQVGTDYYGEPVYRYETVDLNWTFDDYDQNIEYEFDYMEEPESQADALKVVRAYLEKCSPAMRPFSILLVNNINANSASETLSYSIHIGFRTLALAGLDLYASSDKAIADKAQDIITEQVSSKVNANRELCQRFYEVSAQHGWYNQIWGDMPNCTTIGKYNQTEHSGGAKIAELFYGEPYTEGRAGYDFVDLLSVVYQLMTKEEAEAIRSQIVAEMGNFGFIATNSNPMTPTSQEADLELYLSAMLYLGAETFEARYCNAPLVAEKYNLLYDYIVNTLRVEL